MQATDLFFNLFLLFTLLHMSPFSPTLPTSAQPLPLTTTMLLYVSMGYAHMFFGQSLHLLSFSSPPSSLLTAVSLFHVSIPLFLYCSSVYFVHQIPHRSEIIQYLSFIDWLITLSIIISRSIHAVVKGKSPFFFTAA